MQTEIKSTLPKRIPTKKFGKEESNTFHTRAD
jgi:hypothetical protein